MPVLPWIVDGHVRWGCRNSHEDWREEPGDNSKNNSLTWAKRNNSHDFHVAKWNLFRKYSWPCSHFNSELFSRLLDEVIDEGRQFDHSSAKQWGYWKLTFVQTSGLSCSTRHSCLHGVKKSCTQGEKCFLPKRLKVLFLSPAPRAGPSHVMFVRTSMDSESQDATKIPSALTDSRIYSFTKMITLYMCIVKVTIFLSVSLSFSSSVVAMWTSRPAGLCRINRWTKFCWTSWALWKLLLWVSGFFFRHSVDLDFNEEVMKPERFTEDTWSRRCQSRYN